MLIVDFSHGTMHFIGRIPDVEDGEFLLIDAVGLTTAVGPDGKPVSHMFYYGKISHINDIPYVIVELEEKSLFFEHYIQLTSGIVMPKTHERKSYDH